MKGGRGHSPLSTPFARPPLSRLPGANSTDFAALRWAARPQRQRRAGADSVQGVLQWGGLVRFARLWFGLIRSGLVRCGMG